MTRIRAAIRPLVRWSARPQIRGSARPLVRNILLVALVAASPAAQSLDHLTLVAPAAPGGGWDQTARALQHVIDVHRLARVVEVQNVPGAADAPGPETLERKSATDMRVIEPAGRGRRQRAQGRREKGEGKREKGLARH